MALIQRGFTLRVENLDQLKRDFSDLSDRMQRQALGVALRAAGSVVAQDARTRVRRRTGKLAKGIIVKVKVSPRNAEARVGPRREVFYGHFVESGTRPHEIKAKPGKTLSAGRRTFGPVVHHPGATARPFLQPAFEATREEALRKFGSALRQVITKMHLRVLRQQGRA